MFDQKCEGQSGLNISDLKRLRARLENQLINHILIDLCNQMKWASSCIICYDDEDDDDYDDDDAMF